MPFAKPFDAPDMVELVIQLDDDEISDEELEFHSLQNHAREIEAQARESAARLAYISGGGDDGFHELYYGSDTQPVDPQIPLESLQSWVDAVNSERQVHAGLLRRLRQSKRMLGVVSDFSIISENLERRIHNESLTIFVGNVRRLSRQDILAVFAACGSVDGVRIDRLKSVAEVKFRTHVAVERALKLHHTRPYGNRITVRQKHIPLKGSSVDVLEVGPPFQFTLQVINGMITGWS